jgi:hypothetical protein
MTCGLCETAKIGWTLSLAKVAHYSWNMSSKAVLPAADRGQGAGLCDACKHRQLVPNTRGSVFSLCTRSRTDPAYPRYPRLPVLACAGYERLAD